MDGRFESDGVAPVKRRQAEPAKDEAAGQAAGVAVRAPRPRLCRAYVRKRMAERMPELVELLLKQANDGSLGHLKILVGLAGLDKGEVAPPIKRREKSLEKILLEQWAKEDEAAVVPEGAETGLDD